MKGKTCCFTGHREIPINDKEYVTKRLEAEVRNLIKEGVVYFGTGGARGFDLIAAKIVIKMKIQFPHIKLILVLPCSDYARLWKETDRNEYEEIRKSADKIRVLAPTYYKGCMHNRNRHLVNNSSYCVCYCRKNSGGTHYTMNYAVANGLNVIRI